MKNLKMVATAMLLFAGIPASFGQSKTEKIKVAGNCGMCKKHIETAAKKAGAKSADWDKKTKTLTISYNASKTTNDSIQKSIAAAGYDTPKYSGDENAYNNLDECCQYDGKRK